MSSKIKLFLRGLVLYISSLFITGYQVYLGNQSLVIPLVHLYINPVLYPNDPFVSTLGNYAAPIWRLIGILANYIPLETILVTLFLLTRALILFAAAYLAWTINPGSSLSAVGAMAFFTLWPGPLLGHGTLISNYFEHTSLSVAFLLLSTATFYAIRPIPWAILFAIGFNLNSMYGAYACTYFLAVFLMDRQYRSSWKQWVWPAILFLLLSSPTIILTASAFRIEVVDRILWLRASEVRSPHHLYPHTWLPLQFISFTILVFFCLGVILRIRKQYHKLFCHGLVWMIVGMGWLLFAYIAAYVAKSPAMLVMHPARGMDLWFAFATIINIAVFGYLIESRDSKLRLYVFLYFFSILWYLVFDSTTILIVYLVIIATSVLIKPVWKVFFKDADSQRISYIVILLVVVFCLTSMSGDSLSQPIKSRIYLPDAQITEISNWAKENSLIEDMFLVDPDWSEFRVLAQRPIFVSWKDGSAILWERSFVEEWVKRIELLGFDFNEELKPNQMGMSSKMRSILSDRYASLDDNYVFVLSKSYPIHYWIIPVDHPSSFPEVYRTSEYKVVKIQNQNQP